MLNLESSNEIRTRPHPKCYLCGMPGDLLYEGLKDRLFGLPGKWNLKKCSNKECELIWLDPTPIEEDIGKAYKNYYTHIDPEDFSIDTPWLDPKKPSVTKGYLALKYGYFSDITPAWQKLLGFLKYLRIAKRAVLDFQIMYLSANSNGRLLEVGCGSGSMLKMMKDLGWQVEGLDFDPRAVENAKSKGLKVNCGTLEEQGYPENYFDAITMSHVIEHVHNPLSLLKECYRILRPGGKLAMVTPNTNSLGYLYFQSSWLHLDPPRHLSLFSPHTLQRLVKNAGFQETKMATTIRDAEGLFAASHSIKKTGKHTMGISPSRAINTLGQVAQLIEWLGLKVNPNIGEEIALIGKKL